MDVNHVLAFAAIARLYEVDWSGLVKQSRVPFEYDDGMLIIFKGAGPLKPVLSNGNEEWHNGSGNICPVYLKEYECRGMTKTFAKAAWLRYIETEEDYYELPSLDVQEELLNQWRSAAPSVAIEMNTNIATNSGSFVWTIRQLKRTIEISKVWLGSMKYSALA